MTHISVGPFELDASLNGSDIKVSMSVGYHGISMHESFSLSLAHPSITWNSPTVADFSVSLSISYTDSDGSVSVKATETYPSISFHGISKHHKRQSVSVRILPDHALAYIAFGLPSAGLNWMHKHLPIGEFPSPHDVSVFLRELTPSRLAGIKDVYGYLSGPDKGRHLFNGLMSLMKGLAGDPSSKAHFSAVASVKPEQWIEILCRCVADPTVQAAFPGIAGKLILPNGDTAVATTADEGDKHSTAEKIRTIASDVLKGSVIGTAAIGVLAAIVFGMLGVVVAATGGTAAPGASGVAIVAGIILLAAALAVIAIGAVAGLIYLAVEGFLAVVDDAAAPRAGSAYPMLDRAAANPA